MPFTLFQMKSFLLNLSRCYYSRSIAVDSLKMIKRGFKYLVISRHSDFEIHDKTFSPISVPDILAKVV